MSHVERFPLPSSAPEHPGECPSPKDGGAWMEWHRKARAHNAHVWAVRRHYIANALDDMPPINDQTPAERVAFVVGLTMLDCDENPGMASAGGLFGGIL